MQVRLTMVVLLLVSPSIVTKFAASKKRIMSAVFLVSYTFAKLTGSQAV